MDTIIEIDSITKYNLYDELFSCHVCSKHIKAIFMNDHYTVCKLTKLNTIQERSLEKKNKRLVRSWHLGFSRSIRT